MTRNTANAKNTIIIGGNRKRSRVRYTKCARCKGEGVIYTGIMGMVEETCPVCKGSGKARLP